MKKYYSFVSIILAFLIIFQSNCVSKKDKVERYAENGVEVVKSHLAAYKIKDTDSHVSLKNAFIIDAENPALEEKGISRIFDFDVNSQGHIYLLCLDNDHGMILHFNSQGNFVHSFGRKGQGPGEIQGRESFRINAKDEIILIDRYKIICFDKDGNPLRESKIPLKTTFGTVLDNGNFLFEDPPMPVADESGKLFSTLALYDQEYRKIKEMEKIEYPDPGSQEIKAIYYKLLWYADGERIVTTIQKKDYEFHVYDVQGRPVRTIRKDYQAVSPSDEYKKEWIKNLGPRMYQLIKNRVTFPASLPPFHIFLGDESGRIYVMTYEKGFGPGEYIYDIFNPEGALIARVSWPRCSSDDLMRFQGLSHIYGKVKNNRFYCLSENENGPQQLIVSELIWGKSNEK